MSYDIVFRFVALLCIFVVCGHLNVCTKIVQPFVEAMSSITTDLLCVDTFFFFALFTFCVVFGHVGGRKVNVAALTILLNYTPFSWALHPAICD
jgi:hypothetical protein